MRAVYTAQQVRDTEAGLLARTAEGALMRRAAFGLAVHARRMLAAVGRGGRGARSRCWSGRATTAATRCGPGWSCAAAGSGSTRCCSVPDRAHPAGLAALRRAGGRIVTAGRDGRGRGAAGRPGARRRSSGISGRGSLRAPAAELVDAAHRAGVPVLAVDLPSGVDADTGAVDGPAVTATETVTFGALKPVHVLAADRCGPVHLVDIGLAPLLPDPHLQVLDAADVAARWPVPGPTDDKYTQGVTGIAAGSATYPGAAVLATGAAVLATSGMVRFAGSAAPGVRDALAGGGRHRRRCRTPGAPSRGRSARASAPTTPAARCSPPSLDPDVPVCIDADGDHPARPARRPASRSSPAARWCSPRTTASSPGSPARSGPDRVAAARRAAAALGVTVLLKGNATVVADPDGRTLVHPSTTSWAATAGSGDVLTGIIGALLAAGLAAVVGRRLRDVRARSGRAAGGGGRPGAGVPDPGGDPGGDPRSLRPPSPGPGRP